MRQLKYTNRNPGYELILSPLAWNQFCSFLVRIRKPNFRPLQTNYQTMLNLLKESRLCPTYCSDNSSGKKMYKSLENNSSSCSPLLSGTYG